MPELNFESASTLYATHGLHAFAAKCPPPLVRYGLRYYSRRGDTVLDPMAGSGTTLVEAKLNERNSVGIEIDPLARLVAKVKCNHLRAAAIKAASGRLLNNVRRDLLALRSRRPPSAVIDRAKLPEFTNRDHWFLPTVATSLALLAHHIEHLPSVDRRLRDFLWVAFSSTILSKTSVANARDIIHSRHHHHTHTETPDVIRRYEDRVALMAKQVAELPQTSTRAVVHKGDARQLRIEAESVDLVFTSPPYVTALDYTRAHFLAVPWMRNVLRISLEEYLRLGMSYIGTERGPKPRTFEIDRRVEDSEILTEALTQIAADSPYDAKITQRYFLDMKRVLANIARVLRDRKHAILVVCPSHIRRIRVPTHEILVKLAAATGLRLKQQHVRMISERRRILPYMQGPLGGRMSTEYVLVFQKR